MAGPARTAICPTTTCSFRRRAHRRVSTSAMAAPLESARPGSAVSAHRRRRLPGQRREGEGLQQPAREWPGQGHACVAAEHAAHRSGTNAVSSETTVDVWRMVPSVNNVKLTGADGANPWPRGPNTTGGYQLDGRMATCRSRRSVRSRPCADPRMLRPRLLDDLAAFQRVLFRAARTCAVDAMDAT